MKNNQIRVWVDPMFRKRLKQKAAEEDCSILELTRKLSEDDFDKLKEKVRPKKIVYKL